MANHLIENPVGVDIPIQRLQKLIYSKLNWTKFELFGRIYKNEIEGGIVPQYFVSGKEYKKDVYIDGQNNAHSFFVVSDEHKKYKDNVRFECEVKIIFTVNLKKLFPESINRPDSEMHKLIYDLIKSDRNFEITGVQTGMSNVLSGFNIKSIKTKDLHPWHTFSINSNLIYNINQCLKT